MIDKIRAAVSLPLGSKDLNRNAVMDLYDSVFNLKICRTCGSSWMDAYICLKNYLKIIDMAENKNTYKFTEGNEGSRIVFNGHVLTDILMTDELFEKHIKGTPNENLFIVTLKNNIQDTKSDEQGA